MGDLRFADRYMTFDGEVLEVFGGPRLDSVRVDVRLARVSWRDATGGHPAGFTIEAAPGGARESIDVPSIDERRVRAFVNGVQTAIATWQGTHPGIR